MQVPQVDFYLREGGEFVTRTSKELFAGKRVVLFALPGAFTPTCTEQMLPGYEAAYDEIRALGVDEVYCLSMDNSFVMNAWFKDLGVEKVKPLPDGNGSWTTAVKMAVSKENVGLGICSWRYAVVLNDGNLEFSGAEDGMRNNASDDPYEASTPEAIVAYLKAAQAAPEAAEG
jgi:thioredoxin-dependent peroxiredoxin